jgi:hypothetical protein
MSLLPGKLRALHKRPRQADDWYRESRKAVVSLFEAVTFSGTVHDPCCGEGLIVEIAREYGYEATGADLIDRGFGETGIDFLSDWTPRDALAFNAPYRRNEEFIAHSFEVAAGQIAALVRVPFLSGQQRYRDLYRVTPPSLVLVLSRRPSMPPGAWPDRLTRRGGYPTILDWAKP